MFLHHEGRREQSSLELSTMETGMNHKKEADHDDPRNFGTGFGDTEPHPERVDLGYDFRRSSTLRDGQQQQQQQEDDVHKRSRDSHHDSRDDNPADESDKTKNISTQIYTASYLIIFAVLGTLARLGLQDITLYPGAPLVFSELWANFAGTLVFGFLTEDRKLFLEERGVSKYAIARQKDSQQSRSGEDADVDVDLAAAKKEHGKVKKTIPLFIGLATGFCGSFTSFSSFMRDIFLALSNDLPAPLSHPADYSIPTSTSETVSRNGGYSFEALLAVIIITLSLCLSAYVLGTHLAQLLDPWLPSLPYKQTRRFLDPFGVVLAAVFWLAALFLTIFPPVNAWRSQALFAILFAPVGCLARFYLSNMLNPLLPSFPLGTFTVNMLGTAILGMSYDLQRGPVGGLVGCQVLQGIQDGFCGCLTTISTWMGELFTLKRARAYFYAGVSVVVGMCLLIVIMGSMRWTRGFGQALC